MRYGKVGLAERRRRFRVLGLGILLMMGLACGPDAGPRTDRVLPGVVIEDVYRGSTLHRADVRPGDVVLAWHREADSSSWVGAIETPFDWYALAVEQAPRGTLVFDGYRGGVARQWTVLPGSWHARVRPRLEGEALELYRGGMSALRSGHLDQAHGAWQELESRVVPTVPWMSTWLRLDMAWKAAEAQHWDLALASLGEGAVDVRRTPQQGRVFRLQAGEIFYRAAEYGRAGRLLDELLVSLEEGGDPLWRVAVSELLGQIAVGARDLDRLEELLQEALEVAQAEVPESLLQIRAEMHRGYLDNLRERWDLAERYNRRVLKRLESLDLAPLDWGYSQAHFVQSGLLRSAQVVTGFHHDRLLDVLPEIDSRSLEYTSIVHMLAKVATRADDVDAALDYRERELAGLEQRYRRTHYLFINLFGRLGAYLFSLGRLEDAEASFRSCLDSSPGDLPEGQHFFNICIGGLGRVATQRGRLAEARELLESTAARREPGTFQYLWVLLYLSQLSQADGQLDDAAAYNERAMTMFELKLDLLGKNTSNRSRFLARRRSIYNQGIQIALEQGQVDRAFEIHERWLALEFQALLDRHLAPEDFPAEVLERLERLGQEHDRWFEKVLTHDPQDGEPELRTLRWHQARVREEIDDLKARHAPSARVGSVDLPGRGSANRLVSRIEPGTAMISFRIGGPVSLAFVYRHGRDLEVLDLAVNPKTLKRRVDQWRQILAEGTPTTVLGRGALDREAEALYTLLMAPLEPWVEDAERLLLVTDGPLRGLPFAALRRTGNAGRSEYLVEWKPLRTVASLAIQYSDRVGPRRSVRGHLGELIAFGDPEHRRVGGTPQPAVDLPRSARRAWLEWSRLPYSRHEVRRIAEFFSNDSTHLFLGASADEETVKALGDRSHSIIHFAVHGYTDPEFTHNSGLVLSPTQKASTVDGADNGVLQVWEILEDVRLDADLVVLSACETGLGDSSGSEGDFDLARAFQFAGARSVVSTLWSIADDSTAELMIRFYRHLRDGLAKDEALRQAQLDLLREPIELVDVEGQTVVRNFSSPFHWAAFQLSGDYLGVESEPESEAAASRRGER